MGDYWFILQTDIDTATLDRLRHNAYRVVLDGNSYRAPRPLDKQLEKQPEKEK